MLLAYFVFCSFFRSSINNPTSDLVSILNTVFNDQEVLFYLNHPLTKRQPFFFRFEQPPVYNGIALLKYAINVPYKKGKIVKYSIKGNNEEERVIIIIRRIEIENDSATVQLWIPYNGVSGYFSLYKKKEHWVVSKTDVGQT